MSPRPLWDGRSLQHRETDLTLYGVVSSPHCLPARSELTEGSGRRCLDGGRNQISGWRGSFTVRFDNLVVRKTCCEQSKCCVCFCFCHLQPPAYGYDVTLDSSQTGGPSRAETPCRNSPRTQSPCITLQTFVFHWRIPPPSPTLMQV